MNGLDINSTDNLGSTPLRHSAARGQYNAIPQLLQRGADIAATDHAGNNALHVAAASTAQNFIAFNDLVSAKVALEQKNAEGETPLDLGGP